MNQESLYHRLRSAKAFVFDFYGTLVEIDYEPPQMWEMLNQMGYNSYPELQGIWEADGFDGLLTPSFISKPDYIEWRYENLRQFIKLSGVPDSLIETTMVKLLENEKRATKKAVQNAASIIGFLKQKSRKIGLCSNWDHPIESYLMETKLPSFDAVSVSAEVGARKPNSSIFKDICSKLEVDSSDAVFIGDNWFADVVGAIRSGLTPVWIRHFNSPGTLPDHVLEFDTLAEFETELRNIM